MISDNVPIATVASDADTPTFELVRIKLKAGEDVSPNTLVRIPVARNEKLSNFFGHIDGFMSTLILLGCFAFVNSLEYDSGHKPARY
jgi:hypothetical protein